MTCSLRLFGKELDINSLVQGLSLKPHRVWQKGDVVSFGDAKGAKAGNPRSGASFIVSDADLLDFEHQLQDAIHFFGAHMNDIQKMSKFPGVESVIVDFGIQIRDVAVHSDFLPATFVKLASKAGVSIELSHYPAD